MNQKQRDLLCKMVEKKTEKIKRSLGERFPLLCVRGTAIIGRYDRKCLDLSKFATIPQIWKKRWESLKSRTDKLDAEYSALDKDWDAWSEKIDEFSEEERDRKEKAMNNLNDFVTKAIIGIQFAENASQAEAILSSLPTVEQIL